MNDLDIFLESPVATVIFILTILTSIMAFRDENLKDKLLFNPYYMLRDKEYFRIFSSGFIHGDTMHLAFNMMAFYFFCFALEGIVGHWQFAVLYVGCLVLSSVPSLIRHKDDVSYRSLGASGAISGVVLAIIMIMPDLPIGLIFLPPEWALPGWIVGLLYIGYSFYASFSSKGRINHDAHLWGALAGIIMLIIIRPESAGDFIDWVGSKF